MSEISKNPSQFSRKAQSTVDRPSVASEIKSALDLREENLSETGQAYKPVRESTRPIIVDHNFLKNEIEQSTGTKIQEQTSPAPKQTPLKKGELPTIQMNPEPVTTTKSKPGTINATGSSLIRDPKDVRALQNFYNTWEPYFRKGEMTANEFLNMRTDLAKLSRFDREISKSGDLENISKQIRANTNNAYRKQIRGLEDIDADFHSQKTELDALRKGILDRDGNLTDASINKIANSANKGRTVFADQLEQISPGILNRVKVLKAIEDIQNTGGHKVGTYSRAMLGGGGIVAGVMTGNLGIIAASIGEMALSNPEFAVPMLRAYGWNKGLVNAVIDKLKGRASMLNEAPQGAPSLGAFAPEAFKSVADKVKDMPMGLSIEDVSKKR